MEKKKIVFLKSVKPFWIFKGGEKDENVAGDQQKFSY